jgi:hypothetical protein
MKARLEGGIDITIHHHTVNHSSLLLIYVLVAEDILLCGFFEVHILLYKIA